MDDLFSKELPVTVKYKNDREDRRANLHLSIYIQTINTPVLRKDLIVRLTEEKDLFFLYTLRLNEEDFQVLKVQQGLLVDFGAFPQKFIQLLELAISERHKDIPKFVIHLLSTGSDASSASLNVIETNAFKHLTHLSLKLLPGCDRDIKEYLADCLKTYKFENEKLRSQGERSEAELGGALADARASLAEKSRQLETLESDWSKRLADVSRETAKSANDERKLVSMENSNIINKMESEKRVSDENHKNIIRDLESKLGKFDKSNKDLTDTKYRTESSVRELTLKLATLEDEYKRCRQDVVTSRRDSSRLEASVTTLETNAAHSRTKVAVLEQEVKDKDQLLNKTSELLHLEKSHKDKGEEDIDRRKKQIHKLEGSVRKMSDELIKGNEIIKKLQNDIRGYHNKLKIRGQVSNEQEKLLTEKVREIDEMRQVNDNNKKSMSDVKYENKKLTESLEIALKKSEQDQEILKTNENVIAWLNKQVTESQLASSSANNYNQSGVRTGAELRPTLSHHSIESHHATGYSKPVAGSITTAIANSLTNNNYNPYTSKVQFTSQPSRLQQHQAPPPSSSQPAPGGRKVTTQKNSMIPLAKSSPIVDESLPSRIPKATLTTPVGTSPIIQQSAGLFIDSKYLQRSQQGDTPLQPKVKAPSSSSTRLSKDAVISAPLMSSYFPN